MTGPGRIRAAALFGVLLAGTLVGASAAAPATTPPPANCGLYSFSATFGADGTAICFKGERVGDTSVPRLHVTHDGGRRWEKRAADGLVFPSGTAFSYSLVSPDYRADHAFYLVVSTGVWISTDDGRSFVLLSNQVGDGVSPNYGLTPYLETRSLPGPTAGPHTAFVFASIRDDDARSAWLDELPVPVPIAGSPGDDERFLVPPAPGGGPFAFALAVVAAGDPASRADDLYQVFGCTDQFACQTPLFRFPLGRGHLADYLFPAGYATSRTFFLLFRASGGRQDPELWQTTDAGRTFRLVPSVARLLADIRTPVGQRVEMGLAADPSLPDRVYLHVGYQATPWQAGSSPGVQLFRSDDRAGRWTRIGHQTGYDQPGPRGMLPWKGTYGRVVAPGGGRLFAVGADAASDVNLYCSVDGGRSWHRACPR